MKKTIICRNWSNFKWIRKMCFVEQKTNSNEFILFPIAQNIYWMKTEYILFAWNFYTFSALFIHDYFASLLKITKCLSLFVLVQLKIILYFARFRLKNSTLFIFMCFWCLNVYYAYHMFCMWTCMYVYILRWDRISTGQPNGSKHIEQRDEATYNGHFGVEIPKFKIIHVELWHKPFIYLLRMLQWPKINFTWNFWQ